VSTLEKPTTPQTANGQIPVEQTGIFLETIQIYPPEFVLLQNAISRIQSLRREHGDVQTLVSDDYKQIDIYI